MEANTSRRHRLLRRVRRPLMTFAIVSSTVGATLVAAALPAAAANPITLINVATAFNNPIAVDYHQPSNKVLLSVNYSGGQPHNFELVASDGSRTQFSSISGLTDEVYIATVRSSTCQGGFTVGESFTGTGRSGQIARIAANGLSAQIPWVTLPGESGLPRGGLFQDRYCSFGGDLIVTTDVGNVWRITSAGVPTKLASVREFLEGVTTIPVNPAVYGPLSGKVMTGDENNGRVFTIDALGNVTTYTNLGVGSPESFQVIPAGQNFFGVDFGTRNLVGATAAQFAPYVGDIAIASEFNGNLYDLHWDPTTTQFVVTTLAHVAQWEGTGFAPVGIANVPPPTDTTPPACALTGVIAGPPKQIQITIQDADGGLSSITVLTSSNATTVIPAFAVGTMGPVIVTATKIDQTTGATVTLKATDLAGNSITCDPAIVTVTGGTGKVVSQVVTGVAQAESTVSIYNNTPGVKQIDVKVNGKLFKARRLANGEVRTLNVAAALKPGNNNTIVLTPRGTSGSAEVVISDMGKHTAAQHGATHDVVDQEEQESAAPD